MGRFPGVRIVGGCRCVRKVPASLEAEEHMQNETKQEPVLLYSVDDARRALGGMGRSWLYEQIKSGRLRTVKLGARTMIPASEIQRLADAGVESPQAPQ
jgi:hypothetical protein